MAQAAASIDIPVSPNEVWQLIGGFNSLPDWLPNIPKSQLSEGGRVRHLATLSGRASQGGSFTKDFLSKENLKNVRGLAAIARKRGQTLARMAIAWVLRDPRVTSALIGARTVAQLDNSRDALKQMEFGGEELYEIDQYAKDGGIDLWREISLL